jgi:hypothetical protein
MKQSRWSPADLKRQQLVVKRIVVRSELDLRALATARSRVMADIRNTIGIPLAIVGCFAAGMAFGRREPRDRETRDRRLRKGWLGRAAAVLRTIALGAPAYRALFRPAVTSVPKHVEQLS